MKPGPILYCGDPHSQFRHIIEAADHTKASAVVMLGDMEPQRPLEVEMAPLARLGVPWFFIAGNHDVETLQVTENVWNENTVEHNVHGRVVTLPDGTRLAGLAGIFKASVWHPDPAAPGGTEPRFRSRAQHARATPRQDRYKDGHHFRHWGTIYPDELDRLAELEADVLITHEAPGYHPHGFDILDTLAQMMNVKVTVHGHHHDARWRLLDLTARWAQQGFLSFGVGYRGVTAIDSAGVAKVIVPGEFDDGEVHS